jgi:hypothetical protein
LLESANGQFTGSQLRLGQGINLARAIAVAPEIAKETDVVETAPHDQANGVTARLSRQQVLIGAEVTGEEGGAASLAASLATAFLVVEAVLGDRKHGAHLGAFGQG